MTILTLLKKDFFPNGNLQYIGKQSVMGIKTWERDWIWIEYWENWETYYSWEWRNWLPEGEGRLYTYSWKIHYRWWFVQWSYHWYGHLYYNDEIYQYHKEVVSNEHTVFWQDVYKNISPNLMYKGFFKHWEKHWQGILYDIYWDVIYQWYFSHWIPQDWCLIIWDFEKFENGKDGPCKAFFSSWFIWFNWNLQDGKPHGEWIMYYQNSGAYEYVWEFNKWLFDGYWYERYHPGEIHKSKQEYFETICRFYQTYRFTNQVTIHHSTFFDQWFIGIRYIGSFKDGMYEWDGMLFLLNGDQYQGKFHKWRYSWEWCYTFYDWHYYKGNFENWEKSWYWIMTLSNWDKYEWEFRNDLYYGHGSYTFQNWRCITWDFIN